MNIGLLLTLVFLTLSLGLGLLLSVRPLKEKSPQAASMETDSGIPQAALLQNGLGKKEQALIRLRASLKACGVSEQKFYLLSAAACLAGLVAGSMLFSSWLVGFFAGLTCSILPYLYFTVKMQKPSDCRRSN